MIVLDGKSDMCMDKNDKDAKHTRHIAKRIDFVSNGEKFKMHKIYWCEVGLQLEYISINNLSEPDIAPRVKCIMVRL